MVVHSVPSASVTIIDYAFRPTLENVSTGTNIVWTYASNGSDIHTVTSKNLTQTGSPVFASTNPNPLHPGQTYNFTFYSPGRYAYFCGVHPVMTGWINVTGAAINPPGQSSSSVAGLALPIGGAAAIVVAIASVFVYRRRSRKPHGPPSAGVEGAVPEPSHTRLFWNFPDPDLS